LGKDCPALSKNVELLLRLYTRSSDDNMHKDIYKKLNLENGHSCYPFGKQDDINKANQISI